MMKTHWMKSLALVLALAGPCRAASKAGADPFDFLFIDANARAAALGGAYTALAADSNALLYNPAGLGRAPRNEATFMHNRYIEGVTQEYFGLATRYGLGASVNYLSFGRIPRTTISKPAGTGSTFGLTDLAASGGYGKDVGGGLSLGAAYKYIREHVDDVSAVGHAADAGVLWAVPWVSRLRLGAAVQNMGGTVRFQRELERLPLAGRAGAAYAFDWYGRRTTVSADGFAQRHGRVQFGFGAETVLAGFMAVRAGYTSRNETDLGLTAGVGWMIRDLCIDYAVVPFGDFDLAHRMSVTLRWGRERGRAAVPRGRSGSRGAKAAEPGSADALLEKAQALLDEGRFTRARAQAEAALALLPAGDHRMILVHERLGRIAWDNGDSAAAKAAYTESLRLAGELGLGEPGVAEAFLGMGLCLLQEGSPEYAAKFFRRVLELEPSGESARKAGDQLARLEGESRKGR